MIVTEESFGPHGADRRGGRGQAKIAAMAVASLAVRLVRSGTTTLRAGQFDPAANRTNVGKQRPHQEQHEHARVRECHKALIVLAVLRERSKTAPKNNSSPCRSGSVRRNPSASIKAGAPALRISGGRAAIGTCAFRREMPGATSPFFGLARTGRDIAPAASARAHRPRAAFSSIVPLRNRPAPAGLRRSGVNGHR